MTWMHQRLAVWRNAMELACAAHGAARALPAVERFVIGDQLVRAAISVPANIAEGNASGTRLMYRRHLMIARGSLAEVATLLELILQLQLLSIERLPMRLLKRTDYLLQRLITALARTS